MKNNNLPKVGKKYRHLDNNLIYWCIPRKVEHEPEVVYQMICESYPNLSMTLRPTSEFGYFEEILEENSKEKQLSELEKAKREMKYHVQITDYFDKEQALDDIKEAGKRLLKALDD